MIRPNTLAVCGQNRHYVLVFLDIERVFMEEMSFNRVERAVQFIARTEWGKALSQPMSASDWRVLLAEKAPGLPVEVREPLEEFQREFLLEDQFLEYAANVQVRRHPRYLPAVIHSHEFIEIVFFVRGQGIHTINDSTFEMHAGDICVLAPFVRHSLSVFNDQSVAVTVIIRRSTLDETFFSFLTETDVIADFFVRVLYASTQRPYLLFHHHGNERLVQIIQEMFEKERSDSRYKDQVLRLYLMLFLLHLLEDSAADAQVSPVIDAQTRRLAPILLHIQKHYRSISLSDLASRFNFSEAHVSRLIRQVTGRTFSDIVKELRLKRAAHLLGNPTVTISEAAINSGFEDLSHFYRRFKEYFDCTPAEYRRH